jgi:ADP-ribose pyrophosphatase YjhB (NUDIX family)
MEESPTAQRKYQQGIDQVVFETKWFTIDAVSYGSLYNEPYYRLSCSDSVSIIASNIDGKMIMVRQYRPAIEAFTFEFASGYVDGKELPEKAIKREFEEETGYMCEWITYMGELKICPSRINNMLYVFFGKGAELLPGRKQDRDTEVILITADEFRQIVLGGGHIDSSSVAMFQIAQFKGLL